MPYYRVTPQPLMIEAESPFEAAMVLFRAMEDATPHRFEVVGPDSEVNYVSLDAEARDVAITIEFGLRAKR